MQDDLEEDATSEQSRNSLGTDNSHSPECRNCWSDCASYCYASTSYIHGFLHILTVNYTLFFVAMNHVSLFCVSLSKYIPTHSQLVKYLIEL